MTATCSAVSDKQPHRFILNDFFLIFMLVNFMQ